MPSFRMAKPQKTVSITLDGETITAREGEPVAAALVAADKAIIARSPKLHRPRGPSCMRGGCDGCLSRVDGTPNVMTCLTPAREGLRVETQNVVGSRTVDLLRMTDWFFPDGIDHHHLLAGVPGLSSVMQSFARRVAGMGLLPDVESRPAPGRRVDVDALIVGSGPSGLACASRLARAGLSVRVVDDALAPGGSARALGGDAAQRLLDEAPLARIDLSMHTVAAGVYEREVLTVGSAAAEAIRPRVLVLATGAHDGQLFFEGNDVPGVYSARAAALLASEGIAVGARIVVAGDGPFSRALERMTQGHAEITRVALDAVVAVAGSSRVGGVVVTRDGATTRLRADALVIDAPATPAFELCDQAGIDVAFDGVARFVPRTGPSGEATPSAYVVGEARGLPFDLVALTADGTRAAEHALASLGA